MDKNVVEIMNNTIALHNEVNYEKEENERLHTRMREMRDKETALRTKIREHESLIGQLQKCNADMAEVIEKQSGRLKNLKTKFQSFASFVDMKYNGKPLQEWREHLEMVRKAHENEGDKDTVSGQVANESVS